MNHARDGRDTANLIFDVPLSVKDELIRHPLETVGTLRIQTSTRNPQVPDNELATAHIDVALANIGSVGKIKRSASKSRT